MLIEFSVSNFRSFREKQTFQMTAAPRLGKKDNTFEPGVTGERLPNLLKVAAIYGANASGKSNLILALSVIGKIADRAPEAKSLDLPVAPFRFDEALRTEPSKFEVHFIASGTRYQFRLGVTKERVFEETLFAYSRGKEALLYSRRYTGSTESYSFGDSFEADPAVRDAWRKLTGPKTLFISQAVANSSEELTQLRPPFEWLSDGFFVVEHAPSQLYYAGGNVTKQLLGSDQLREELGKYLRDIDIPVSRVRYENESTDSRDAESRDESSTDDQEQEKNPGKTTLTHETRLGTADFDLSEESDGTRSLIGFWLPWKLLSVGGFKKRNQYLVIIVDELDSSLHPEVMELLVKKHLASASRAQLIFTTHDTHLMSTQVLRRDQFWLSDRDSNGATKLRSIYSFRGREGEDVEKRYFEGRYRGLPILRGK